MNAVHDDAASYAIDALDGDDTLLFERHLRRCVTCQDELSLLHEAVAQLGLVADAPAPPPHLRAAVLAAVASTPQFAADESTQQDAATRLSDARQSQRSADGESARSATVRPLRAARRAAHPRTFMLLVAAVTVLTVALGGTLTAYLRQPAQGATSAADVSLLTAPDVRVLPAALPDGSRASFVVSRSQNRAQFVSPLLLAAGTARTYQLWTLRGDEARPDTAGGDVAQ